MGRANRTTGVPGVTYRAGKAFMASPYQAFHKGKYLGVYRTIEQAVAALEKHKAELAANPEPCIIRMFERSDRERVPRSWKGKEKSCAYCGIKFTTTPRRRMLCAACFEVCL